MNQSEASFFDRLVDITGSHVVKTASFTHPVPAVEDPMEKIASMSFKDIVGNKDFLDGVEESIQGRMSEIDALFAPFLSE